MTDASARYLLELYSLLFVIRICLTWNSSSILCIHWNVVVCAASSSYLEDGWIRPNKVTVTGEFPVASSTVSFVCTNHPRLVDRFEFSRYLLKDLMTPRCNCCWKEETTKSIPFYLSSFHLHYCTYIQFTKAWLDLTFRVWFCSEFLEQWPLRFASLATACFSCSFFWQTQTKSMPWDSRVSSESCLHAIVKWPMSFSNDAKPPNNKDSCILLEEHGLYKKFNNKFNTNMTNRIETFCNDGGENGHASLESCHWRIIHLFYLWSIYYGIKRIINTNNAQLIHTGPRIPNHKQSSTSIPYTITQRCQRIWMVYSIGISVS